MTSSDLPHNIKLYSWPGVFGLPSSSHFCLKVIYALNYLKIPFEIVYLPAEIRPRFPSWLKHNQLPAIEIGNETIEDSTHILKRLNEFCKGDLKLYPTTARELSDTLLLEDWSDERFHWFYHYYSLRSKHSRSEFEQKVLKSTFIDQQITVKVFRMKRKLILRLLGIGDREEIENRQTFRDCIALLDQKLSLNNFLTYTHPTASDFACFPVLQLLLASKLEEVISVVKEFPRVEKWMQSMQEVVVTHS